MAPLVFLLLLLLAHRRPTQQKKAKEGDPFIQPFGPTADCRDLGLGPLSSPALRVVRCALYVWYAFLLQLQYVAARARVFVAGVVSTCRSLPLFWAPRRTTPRRSTPPFFLPFSLRYGNSRFSPAPPFYSRFGFSNRDATMGLGAKEKGRVGSIAKKENVRRKLEDRIDGLSHHLGSRWVTLRLPYPNSLSLRPSVGLWHLLSFRLAIRFISRSRYGLGAVINLLWLGDRRASVAPSHLLAPLLSLSRLSASILALAGLITRHDSVTCFSSSNAVHLR
ncbi:hypothetical protein FRC18_009160 [Serendipita sp. 400]|nr:hypothetical protein FRC18_009160 [Serendipita sp. 400]